MRKFFLVYALFIFSSYAEEGGSLGVIASSEGASSIRKTQMKRGKIAKQAAPVDSCCPEESSCPPKPQKSLCCNDPSSHLQLGGSYRYAYVDPSKLSDLTGHLRGLNASYDYQKVHLIYQGVTFAWRQGTAHGTRAKRTICDIDTQGRIGYTFGKGRHVWLLSLFTGLGYRHLGETSTIEGASIGYDYNDLYVPVGFWLNGALGKYLFTGLHVQWRPQVYPTVAISSLNGARFDTKYMLGNVLTELPISIVLSRANNICFVLKPFFEYWQDGATYAKSSQGIPLGISQVTYLFGGVDVNFSWSF